MTSADRALLTALAAETGDLRARLESLAGLVGELIRALPEDARDPAVAGVQAFDVLGQRLDALTAVLSGLGRSEAAAGLVAAVPLSDMAARLNGDCLEATAAGDLMLFD